MTIVASQYFKK